MPQTSHCLKMPFPGWWSISLEMGIPLLTLIVQVGVPLLQPSKPSNAVWISSASSEMQSKLKDTVGSIFASDSDKSDKTITKD